MLGQENFINFSSK